MIIVNGLILGLALSVDAVCVSINDGIKEKNIKPYKRTLIALSFGIFQFCMPLLGYFLALIIKTIIEKYICYIAFAIFLFLALKSLYDAIKEIKKNNNEEKVEEKKLKLWEISLQDIATSIDALTIGIINVELSLVVALITFAIIGIVTFILSLIAFFFGKLIGTKIEKFAPFISTVIFLALAIKFLVQAFI